MRYTKKKKWRFKEWIKIEEREDQPTEKLSLFRIVYSLVQTLQPHILRLILQGR